MVFITLNTVLKVEKKHYALRFSRPMPLLGAWPPLSLNLVTPLQPSIHTSIYQIPAKKHLISNFILFTLHFFLINNYNLSEIITLYLCQTSDVDQRVVY